MILGQVVIFLVNAFGVLLMPTVVLLISGTFALICWRRRVSRVLLAIGLLYFYLAASGILGKPLLSHLLRQHPQMISQQAIQQHKALILLGGGLSHYPNAVLPQIISYARINQAARIYHQAEQQGVNYTLFVSGGDVQHNGHSEASVYAGALQQLGVPRANIVLEDKSLNTFQNAKFMQALVEKYPYQEYVLVTSATHMPRAQAYFRFFGINTVAAPSDYPYPILSLIPSSYNLAIFTLGMHELGGMWRFNLYNALGLNKSSSNGMTKERQA